MINLILSILSSTAILLLFKLMDRYKISVFPPIVINYIVATIFGLTITSSPVNEFFTDSPEWLYLSGIIGALFIINFYFIGNSTRIAGIAVTTVAAKMSFVLPVVYSLSYDIHDNFTIGKVIQISLACVAVLLVVSPNKNKTKVGTSVWYPVIIFFGLGILDTLVKFSQYNYIKDEASSSMFSAVSFGVAGIIGILVLLFNRKLLKEVIKPKVLLFGTLLGLTNFGSIFFLINTLNDLKINNSLVFGINNIGIVGCSVLIAFLIFHEKFTKIKWIGLILSIFVLILMLTNF